MNLSPALKEILSLHEIFHRLGFPTSSIFVEIYSDGPAHPGRPYVQVTLRPDGDSRSRDSGGFPPAFVVDILEDCSEVTPATWTRATEWWNSASQKEVMEVFENSCARRDQVMLVFALSKKGLIRSEAGAK